MRAVYEILSVSVNQGVKRECECSWCIAKYWLSRYDGDTAAARVRVAVFVRSEYSNGNALVGGGSSGGRRGPPEAAPCAAPQCGNGAPAPLVSVSTNFPIKYG